MHIAAHPTAAHSSDAAGQMDIIDTGQGVGESENDSVIAVRAAASAFDST